MILALTAVCVATLSASIAVWIKRTRNKNEMERHSITAEELYSILISNRELCLLDVRQPLDLLAYPEIISGARRLPPNEVLENPSLISRDQDTVVYCTCPSDKTSRTILRRVLALQFLRIKFLKGGLAAWKANGYPVERYQEVFHLYAPSAARPAG